MSAGEIQIRGATLNDKTRNVDVDCSNGQTYSFPYVWLRDNCQCDVCFNKQTLSRSHLIEDLDVDVEAKDVTTGDQDVQITWNDGHISKFDVKWLLERSFTDPAQTERQTWYKLPTKSWGSEFKLPKMDFNQVMTDDRALYDWIHDLAVHGLVLLSNCPLDTSALYKVAQRVAFLRKTNYGETWKVKAIPQTTNIAYTTQRLGLHTDLPYYGNQPGVQLMMCIKQCCTKGGDNTFADGCHLAERMRKEHPEHFKTITTTPVDYVYEEDDFYQFYKIKHVPMMMVDEEGELTRLSYNQHKRDSYLNVPLDRVEPFYRAFKQFSNMLYDPSNVFQIRLQAGDMICIDNMRVIHGREAYTMEGDDSRHYEGGYVDWDEMNSRMRVLRRKLRIDC